MDRSPIQIVFDAVVAHAKTMTNRSMHDYYQGVFGNGCAYRGTNGNKCFIGGVIKDEFYSKELEGKEAAAFAVRHAVENSLNLPPGSLASERWALNAIQGVHDSCTVGADQFKDSVLKHLRNIASNNGLTFPE